jgi:hypothetical protein
MLLLLKIALPPLLVAAVSLIARAWGPTVGGILLGLPWMTGPVLFFLALDNGVDFAAGACTGIQLGVVCVAAFMLAYATVARFAGWPTSLAAAVGVFILSGLLAKDIALPLWGAAVLAVAALGLAYLLMPRPRSPHAAAALPWWDIPARMLTTFVRVAVIMLSADLLGPRLSGIVSTYPATISVVGAFTHRQWGADALCRMLRGITTSMPLFVIFFLMVGLLLPVVGLAYAFAAACILVLAVEVMLLRIMPR